MATSATAQKTGALWVCVLVLCAVCGSLSKTKKPAGAENIFSWQGKISQAINEVMGLEVAGFREHPLCMCKDTSET